MSNGMRDYARKEGGEEGWGVIWKIPEFMAQ